MEGSLLSQRDSMDTQDSVFSYFFPDEMEMDALTIAAAAGDLEEVKRLLDPAYQATDANRGEQIELGGSRSPTPVDINAQSIEFPIAPIHAAVKNGHENIVRFLLTQPGIDVNIVDTGGYTPLLLAAESGNLNILKALFEANGVDKNAVNMYEEDALMCASKAGHLQLVEYLVPRVEDICRTNQLGYTAVSLAASEGHLQVVKHLTTLSRRKYIDINAKSEDKGRSLLMLAAMFGSLELVQYILNTKWCQDLDLEATDSKGSTVLMLTAAVGYTDIVAELCKFGAHVTHANDGTGYNALMLASLYGHHETVRVLLKQENTNILADDHLGRNALFLAAQKNKLECVRVILENHCSPKLVNAITNDGEMTALTATYDPEIKLELIKANGCDIRTVLTKQVVLRKNIRQAIIDSGERNTEAWSNILHKKEDLVLPLLALMAEDLSEREVAKGFWKYMLESSIGKEYQCGKKCDPEQNSIYHYLARSKYAANCTRTLDALISKDDLATVLGLQNKQGNTFLHTAAHFGNLTNIFKVVKNKMGGIADQYIRAAFKIENNDKQTFIAAAVKSTSEECTVYLQEIMKTLMSLRPRGYDMNFIYKTCDTGGNTLLHLAAKRAKFNMISYLAGKPIDERALNDAGFNPLHIAVVDNNYELFEHIFGAFKHRFGINEPTGENETVLHIAAKQGNIEMLQKFVELGGDLSSQDNDGHTPLHDCLQQVHLEGGSTYRERCEKFKAVWDKVVEVAVIWWCGPSFLNVPVPDEDSQLYQDFKRDAVYYLRSIVRDKKGLSVLQYAAYLGVTACVETVITQEDVFVRKHYTGECKGNSCEFEIEVTNLLPEYVADIEYSYEGYGCFKEEIDRKHKYKGRKTTLIETLAKVKPPLKASEMLQCVPFFRLTKWQWYIYQFFSIVWLFIHCAVMTYCSLSAQTEIRNFAKTNAVALGITTNSSENSRSIMSGRENLTSDILILIYALVIFVLMTILPISRLIRYLQKKSRSRKVSQDEQPKYKIYHEYVVDKGAILSSLTYVLAFLVEQMSTILPICFAVFASGLFYVVETKENVTMRTYAWMKGNFLLFGWLLVLIPARTYSPIYNFLSTLKFIIIKDMIPFVLFYITITVGFSCAIQLQFQLLTADTINDAENASGFHGFFTRTGTVLYELVIMTTGMDTDLKHIQSVADLFHEDNQNSMFIEALLIVYAIISVIILLNMLIAMMGTTMSMVVEKHGTGWRQYQVVQALRIRNFLLDMKYCCRQERCTCCGTNGKGLYKRVPNYQQRVGHYHQYVERTIVFDKIMQRKARRDELTNRWYLKLTRFELKEIRARYWQHPETVVSQGEDMENATDASRVELTEVNDDEIEHMMQEYDLQDEDFDGTDSTSKVVKYKKSLGELEKRMTKMETKLESIENTLTSKLSNIELILSDFKTKVHQ